MKSHSVSLKSNSGMFGKTFLSFVSSEIKKQPHNSIKGRWVFFLQTCLIIETTPVNILFFVPLNFYWRGLTLLNQVFTTVFSFWIYAVENITPCNHTRKLNEFQPAFAKMMVTHRMPVFVCARHEIDITLVTIWFQSIFIFEALAIKFVSWRFL